MDNDINRVNKSLEKERAAIDSFKEWCLHEAARYEREAAEMKVKADTLREAAGVIQAKRAQSNTI